MKSRTKVILAVAITAVSTFIITAVLAVCGFIYFGRYAIADLLQSSSVGRLSSVEAILDEVYLYDYDKEQAGEEAISAYVNSLDEPYTEYYPPETYKSYIDAVSESYTGIGIIVAVNSDNRIEIIAAFEDSPAYNAGILPGDILTAVDGTEYDGTRLNDAVNVIRNGTAGTDVAVTILRNNEEAIDLTITRDNISENSVKSEMLDENTGYIRISAFNMASGSDPESTSSKFEMALDGLKEQGANKIVIDLRDNPGGILDEACKIADMLLPEGIITYTEDKKGNRIDYTSDEKCTDIPVAILINNGSASASEVLTGALKDYGRAVVVGGKSYGKGIVQNVYSLQSGAGLSVTSARYYTPGGVCIHETGIEPDIAADMPVEYQNTYASFVEHSKDTQLMKAVEALNE